MTGKVYFISAPGRIKIGFTLQPEKRFNQLKCCDMESLTVIAVRSGSRLVERALHEAAKSFRLRGEWFADCPEVRSIMDEFVAGKFDWANINKPPMPPAKVQQSALGNALQESRKLFEEIKVKLANRENVSDLVDRLCFLGEEIIIPEITG